MFEWDGELFFIGLIIFGLIFAVFVVCYLEQKDQDSFVKKHNCHKVSESDGTILPVFGANGAISTVYVPGSETYLCANGKYKTF